MPQARPVIVTDYRYRSIGHTEQDACADEYNVIRHSKCRHTLFACVFQESEVEQHDGNAHSYLRQAFRRAVVEYPAQ